MSPLAYGTSRISKGHATAISKVMETAREPTETELQLGELYERIRAWLAGWKKDDLVLLATALMVNVTYLRNPAPQRSR